MHHQTGQGQTQDSLFRHELPSSKKHVLLSQGSCVAAEGSVSCKYQSRSCPPSSLTSAPWLCAQASRFQIIKTHVARTAVTEDKESIEEMELAATNSNSLEAWLAALEVWLLWFSG